MNAPAQQGMVSTAHLAGNWCNPPMGIKGLSCISSCGENAACQYGCIFGWYLTREATNPNKFSGCCCISIEYDATTDTLKDGCGGTHKRN